MSNKGSLSRDFIALPLPFFTKIYNFQTARLFQIKKFPNALFSFLNSPDYVPIPAL